MPPSRSLRTRAARRNPRGPRRPQNGAACAFWRGLFSYLRASDSRSVRENAPCRVRYAPRTGSRRASGPGRPGNSRCDRNSLRRWQLPPSGHQRLERRHRAQRDVRVQRLRTGGERPLVDRDRTREQRRRRSRDRLHRDRRPGRFERHLAEGTTSSATSATTACRSPCAPISTRSGTPSTGCSRTRASARMATVTIGCGAHSV